MTPPIAPAGVSGALLAMDETYWSQVGALFNVTKKVIQLENANWGMMARPVEAVYRDQLAMVNSETSYYQRRDYPADMAPIQAQTAKMLGVAPDEIVFTRGATEALQALIGGYNRLKPGDAVLYADLDYDSMITAMEWLKARRGVEVIRFDIPEPATRANVLAAYDAALKAHPNIKLVLTTHVSHRTGIVMPIADISDMARARGADIVVDAAHSFGQIDFKLPDLKADFIGVNLHKWIGAPIGCGVMYVRKDRIGDIDPYMGEPDRTPPSIASRVHSGTVNFAAFLTIPKAIEVHDAIGVANKAARLKHLRDLWAERVRENRKVEVLAPADMSAGITSFRIKGKTSEADNVALARRLLDEFGIFTVHRIGLAYGCCVRVAPSYFNTPAEIETLSRAIETVAASA
jgi:selenocysteine lyase/cysteine desulfurase